MAECLDPPRNMQPFSTLRRATDSLTLAQHVYAVDIAADGRKRYAVGNDPNMFTWYTSLASRNVHEVLVRDQPCRLFVDVEYVREEYPQADEEAVIDDVIRLCRARIPGAKTRDPIMMCASDAHKMSWHVLFPGATFANIVEMGMYVRHVVHTWARQHVASLFYGLQGCVLDLQVYGNNRTFRMWGSTKYGSDRVLRRLRHDGTFSETPETCRELVETLVLCHGAADSCITLPRTVSSSRGHGRSVDVPPKFEAVVQWLRERFPSVAMYGAKLSGHCISVALLSKKCVIARKEHKSNHVTCHVDMKRAVWYMGCFKCRGRGPVHNIADPHIVKLCSKFG